MVNAPEQVIQQVGECIGCQINPADAKSIAVSCQWMNDSVETGLPDAAHAQMGHPQQANKTSEFANDPPSIHLSRLTPEQTGRLTTDTRKWLEKYDYITPAYPGGDASKAIVINIQGGIKMCMPASLTQRSTYILLEQEDWFEPEIRFLRQWIMPGMRCADIGAEFGCYALSLSQCVGSEGMVWALEPDDGMADLLYHSIGLNRMDHCHLIRMTTSKQQGAVRIHSENDEEVSIIASDDASGQWIATGRIDDFAERNGGWQTLDFIRINAEHLAGDVLEGGQTLLRQHSPLLMIASTTQYMDLITQLAELEYAPYHLLPNLHLLASFDVHATTTQPLNLFFCKKDRAKKLRQSGYLVHSDMLQRITQVPKKNIWQQYSCQFPYIGRLASTWNLDSTTEIPETMAYRNVLNMAASACQ